MASSEVAVIFPARVSKARVGKNFTTIDSKLLFAPISRNNRQNWRNARFDILNTHRHASGSPADDVFGAHDLERARN